MPTLKTLIGLLFAASSGALLLACAASPAAQTAAHGSSSVSSKNAMNASAPTAKQVVSQLVAGLKSEQMLKSSFFDDASLQKWFGAHQRTSVPSPLKAGVQREALVFGATKLNLTRAQAGDGFGFSLHGPSPWGLTSLSADDLTSLLGAPQKKVDIVAQQTISAYPMPEAGQLPVSPQPIVKRGDTKHTLGNQDLYWTWKSGSSTVEFNAQINGDGTVSTVFGNQELR